MGHAETVTAAPTAASVASTVRPGLLTPAQAAPLLGYSRRRLAELIADGRLPAGSVIRVGKGTEKPRTRILLARLITAGWVLPQAGEAVAS